MKRKLKREHEKGILLSDSELQDSLKKLKNWTIEDGKLKREYTFGSFIEAFSFLTGIAILSESMNHFVEIYNCERLVVVKLSSPALKGISTIDVLLAKKIDQLS